MILRYGIWVDTGFKTVYADGIDWIPRKDAFKTLSALNARLPETGENGVIHWVDGYTDEHRRATPHFLTGHGWCYKMADLRDGEDYPVLDFEALPFNPAKPARDTSNFGVKGLTKADVEYIRSALKEGVSGAVIALSLGISQSMVSRIKSGERWTHAITD